MSTALDFALGWDKNGLYYRGQLIEKDSTGFAYLGSTPEGKEIWKTKKHVFSNDKIIKDADASTFEPVEYAPYFKDKNHVYYGDIIINGADPATIQLGTYGYHDKIIFILSLV